MDRFAVIGLGRFGGRLARRLSAAGAEVIAIDRDREVVEEARDVVTLAVALDATDEQALRLQGVDQVDVAVIAMGEDFEAVCLITALLKSMKVKKVVARARTEMQTQILTRIGADGVISPEDEAADRWSHRLLAPFIIEHVELARGYALVQLPAPQAWAGRTLAELDLRARHNVTVVAIKRRAPSLTQAGAEVYEDSLVDLPQPDSVVGEEDVLVLAGFDRDIEKLPR